MVKYPLHFKVESRAEPGIMSHWQSRAEGSSDAGDKTVIECAVPKEFGGPGDAFSPEALYAMALTNCYVATFKIVAERSDLSFDEVIARTDVVVDRGEGGRPFMKSAVMHIDVRNPSDWDRCEKLLRNTVGMCLALNSVKTDIRFDFQMHSDEFASGPSLAA